MASAYMRGKDWQERSWGHSSKGRAEAMKMDVFSEGETRGQE